MEWMFFIGCLLWILALVFFFPNLLAPRCPDCSTRLESGDIEDSLAWRQWRLSWRRFFCPHCTYAYRRPIIHYVAKKVNHEASSVH